MAERGLSERWIDERAALLSGGSAQVCPARWWLKSATNLAIGLISPVFLVANLVADGVEHGGPPSSYAEVAIYPRGAGSGALPLVIAPFPIEVGRVVHERGEVAVRGELAAGHGVVVVLPDGTPVGCAGPTTGPPPFMRRRVKF